MSNCSNCPSNGNCNKDKESCGIKNNPNNHIGKIIAVMSGKGGVGKSTMTVLLAKAYAAMGFSVGIMDADITGPSIPRLMGLEKEKAYGNGNQEILTVDDKDGIKTMSINYLIDEENTPVIWRGPIIANAIKQFYNEVIWGDLDVLFIDMPPGTGDVALTVMQSLPISGVIMVSTPQPMVSMIVSKAINMLKQMNVKVFGVIENMAYIECPDCGKKIQLHQSNVEEFVKENQVECLGELPMNNGFSNIRDDESLPEKDRQQIIELIMPMAQKIIHLSESKK